MRREPTQGFVNERFFTAQSWSIAWSELSELSELAMQCLLCRWSPNAAVDRAPRSEATRKPNSEPSDAVGRSGRTAC
jgi:hypothetical protein